MTQTIVFEQGKSLTPATESAEHLLIFARLPEPGKSKTRLIPTFGSERAAAIYRALALQSLQTAERFAAARCCALTVHFSGGDAAAMAATFGAQFRFVEQIGDDLGARLTNATKDAFASGSNHVAVIGTDCQQLSENLLTEAFDALHDHNVVLGPATDGGYYLIGTQQFQPQLFNGIDWSSERVLAQTLAIAKQSMSSVRQLEPLPDVDFAEDVVALRSPSWEPSTALFEQCAGRLSIIIPTLNEAQQLPGTLVAIGRPGASTEIVVVDGGSSDATPAIAQEHGCKIITANRGRARQLNAGAAIATGEYLLFLHADTILPSGYANYIDECLSQGNIAGAFQLKLDGTQYGLRVVEWGANLRARWRQMPYGDQALFMRANTFYQLGGYQHLPIMEDYELVQRLRRLGKIHCIAQPVLSSARRWLARGILRTTMLNQICIAAYRLGVPTSHIAWLYGKRPQKTTRHEYQDKSSRR